MSNTPTSVVAIIKSAPRLHGGKSIHWAADIMVPATVAMFILSSDDHDKAIDTLRAGAPEASRHSLVHFARGNKADGTKWPALREALQSRGYAWREPHGAKVKAPTSPAADIVPPAPVVLATTNKGEVVTATLPTAATAPSAMAAKPGDYATKTDATRCVLDTKTKDILVITTRRIEFGTPAWCEKMVEINSKPKS